MGAGRASYAHWQAPRGLVEYPILDLHCYPTRSGNATLMLFLCHLAVCTARIADHCSSRCRPEYTVAANLLVYICAYK